MIKLKIKDMYHVIVEVSQGCPLGSIINYLIQYIHFHSSYIMSYLCVKFKENPWVGTFVTPPFGFKKKSKCTIRVAKTKALISFAVAASLFSPMQIVGFLTRRLIYLIKAYKTI